MEQESGVGRLGCGAPASARTQEPGFCFLFCFHACGGRSCYTCRPCPCSKLLEGNRGRGAPERPASPWPECPWPLSPSGGWRTEGLAFWRLGGQRREKCLHSWEVIQPGLLLPRMPPPPLSLHGAQHKSFDFCFFTAVLSFCFPDLHSRDLYGSGHGVHIDSILVLPNLSYVKPPF